MMMMTTMMTFKSRRRKGASTPLDWVDMVQSLDVTLDTNQIDKIIMLLQCHSEMLECQAMVSKMLAELGKSVDPVTFRLILQTVIRPVHQINLPDSYLTVPKKVKKVKLLRDVKIIHQITPNPELMKDWAEDSMTSLLGGNHLLMAGENHHKNQQYEMGSRPIQSTPHSPLPVHQWSNL